jgi:hypothetical protein
MMIPNIVKEREKIIFGGTLGVLIIGALLLGNLSAKRQLAVTERIARVEQGDILSGSDSETEGNSGLAGVLKSVPPISLSEGLELSGRDIFFPGAGTTGIGTGHGWSPTAAFSNHRDYAEASGDLL